MTPAQNAVGEVFIGLMEALLGQHRSYFHDCGHESTHFGDKLRVWIVSPSQNISVSIWIKRNGDVPHINVKCSNQFKVHFLVKSLTLAMGVLRHGK